MINGYVYLLTELGDNLRYKIGITKNPIKKRLAQLRTGNSDDIEILKSYRSYNYKEIERMLHAKFATDRKHLEWFTLSDEQVMSFLIEAKKADETIDFLKKNNSFFY